MANHNTPHSARHQPAPQQLQALINLIDQGQLDQAVAMATSMLSQHPNVFILHNLLGIALNSQQKFDAAIQSYAKALKLQSNVPDIYFNLGIAQSSAGKVEDAIASYRKAIHLQPKFFEAYGNLGIALQGQGKLEEAIASYRKALAIHEDATGYFNLATALRDQGKLDDAITSYRKALTIFPNYVQAHNNLGETLRDQGNMTEAIKSYQQALTINPTHAQANYNMGEFFYLAGRYDDAIAHFDKAQLDDSAERILYCLYKAEKFDTFEQKLKQTMAGQAHVSPFIANLAAHYAINFNLPNAYGFCKNAMQLVYHNSIPALAQKDSTLLKNLLHDIESAQIAERKQGRLHHGIQSAGNLFKRHEASFKMLADLIKLEFQAYRKRFATEDCELIRRFPETLEFTSSWYVKMQRGGHLTSHFHELGWLSGAVYLKMPSKPSESFKQSEQCGELEGNFEYGLHGDDYPQKHSQFPSASIAPGVGDIVLFPSSLFHRTIPFSSHEERICIAFDLKPATFQQAT